MAVDLSVPADLNMMLRKSRFKSRIAAAASQPTSSKCSRRKGRVSGLDSGHACTQLGVRWVGHFPTRVKQQVEKSCC